jgi:Fe-S cluster assembly ATP-binding protein
MNILEISDLHASIEDTEILKGVNLTIRPGEIHAIMGPNGAGKSTLAKVLSGHPAYTVTQGQVLFMGQDLLALEPEERARLGLFMSFQYPPEINGVATREFLYQAMKARKDLSKEAFEPLLQEKMTAVGMPSAFAGRGLNEGFSGGEKKRSEILQMALLEPTLALLDETDSGLDIDALRVIAEGVNKIMSPSRSLLVITHYQRLLDYIRPDYVHIFSKGKFVQSGSASLALELEREGYDRYRDA